MKKYVVVWSVIWVLLGAVLSVESQQSGKVFRVGDLDPSGASTAACWRERTE